MQLGFPNLIRYLIRYLILAFSITAFSVPAARAQTATEDTLMNLAIHGSLWTLVGSSLWGKNPLKEGLHLNDRIGWGYQMGSDRTTQLFQMQLTRPFKNTLYRAPKWDLTAHWEFDGGVWYSTKLHPKNDKGYFIGITPVFNYTWRSAGIQPYLEVGAGVKYLDSIIVEELYKSTQFQFGDIFGLGIGDDHFQVGWRYLHISNANIETPNPGNNFQTVHISYLF
jgi:hypothetical protein